MPVPIAAVHIELVEVDKEEVVFKKTPTALPTALHVVIELEDVMVDKEGVPNTYRTLITQRQCHYLSLAV